MRQWIRSVLLMTLSSTLGGCSGWQSALDAQGSQSEAIRHIFFVFLAIAAVVWIAVAMVLVIGLRRRTRAAAGPLDLHPPFERRAGLTIFLLGIGTTVVVLALSLVSYAGQHVVFGKGANPLTVKIIGHQWWWEVLYTGDSPHRSFVSANEIRVPVGEPVKVELESADVIHSFWVPSLTGKMDLITGQQNQLEFTATKPGMYRGQCAEFCGIQHAHMAFTVLALQPDEFRAWRRHENENAHVPDDPLGHRGEETFRGRGCASLSLVSGAGCNRPARKSPGSEGQIRPRRESVSWSPEILRSSVPRRHPRLVEAPSAGSTPR